MAIPALALPFVQIGIGLLLNIGTQLLTPRQKIKGPQLNDLKVAKSNFGVQIPIIYGSNKIAGNLIWSTDIKEVSKTTSGGKGIGGPQTTNYTYFANAAFLFTEGPIQGIRRLWLDNKLVYNLSETATSQEIADSQTFKDKYLRIYLGSSTQLADPLIQVDKGANTPAYRYRSYIVLENFPLADFGNRIPLCFAECCTSIATNGTTITRNRVTVSSIVRDLCLRANLSTNDIDLTEIPDSLTTQGYSIAQTSDIKELLTSILPAFDLDVVDSNGKLKFIKSKRPFTTASINQSDLSTVEINQSSPFTYEETILQEIDLPFEVDVNFVAWKQDYVDATQRAIKQTTNSKTTQVVNFPLCLSSSEAATIADHLLYQAWIRRSSFKFYLPISYIFLEPGDLINFPSNGTTVPLLISKVDIGANYILQVEAVTYEGTIYDTTRYIANDNEATPTLQTTSANSDFRIIETNNLSYSDPNYQIYTACSGGTSWSGAQILSTKQVGSYQTTEVVGAFSGRSTIGIASLLPSHAPGLDTTSTLAVALIENSPQLESIDDTALAADVANMAVVGQPGRWEIIKYKTATLTSTNHYQLTNLIRGYRGTEGNIGNHQANDQFIQLKGSTFGTYALTREDIGRTFSIKAVSRNSTEADTSAITYTYLGTSSKPFAPTDLTATLTTGDWVIAWHRRDRKAAEGTAYGSQPLSDVNADNQDFYEVDIFNGATVVRTIQVAGSQTVTYTAAQQTTDFSSAQTTLTYAVYQMSLYVGRGYQAKATA